MPKLVRGRRPSKEELEDDVEEDVSPEVCCTHQLAMVSQEQAAIDLNGCWL
jgi:hypothetical protein